MVRLFLKFVVFSLLLVTIMACENAYNANATKEKSTDSIALVSDSNMISFSRDLEPYFDEDCSECHDYLKKGESYKMLTTKQSSCKESPNYIDTINPTASYLYIKLHDVPKSGVNMKGDHWSEENIEKLLLWIEQGAKNN